MGNHAAPRIELVSKWDPAALEGVWQRLLADDPAATVFQTWEWNAAWWCHFGSGRRLMVMIAHGPHGPLALAPLAWRNSPAGVFRRVEFLGTGVSDYLGFIGPPETMRDCVAAFLGALAAWPQWDLVDLQQLNPEQAARAGLADGPEALDLPADACALHWGVEDTCPVLELPESWDALLRLVGKKMRFNIGYYERLLRRDHEVALGPVQAGDVGQAMEEFIRLHAQRWRRRWLPGALYSGRLLRFHRDVAPALMARGYLCLYRMRLNGRTAAALYCFRYGRRAFYYLGGFDPALARYSPGTVLTAHAIRHSLEGGCREFDFLRGREEYKYRWPVVERANSRLEIARPDSRRSRLALGWNARLRELQHAAVARMGGKRMRS